MESPSLKEAVTKRLKSLIALYNPARFRHDGNRAVSIVTGVAFQNTKENVS
jgi:hypothetical protein